MLLRDIRFFANNWVSHDIDLCSRFLYLIVYDLVAQDSDLNCIFY